MSIIRIEFISKDDLHKAALIHGQYLEEIGYQPRPDLSMLLKDEELSEMSRRLAEAGVSYTEAERL